MDKHIFATALWLNESIALLRVEPFHGTFSHRLLQIGFTQGYRSTPENNCGQSRPQYAHEREITS
jgi:hypothetical protein